MKWLVERAGREGETQRIVSYLLDEGGHAVEIHADQCQESPKLQDIYIGRVDRVVPGVKACFVEFSPGISGYLPLEEIKDPIYTKKGRSPDIMPGDELLVQISREAFGKKDVSLSTRLSLFGRYLILTLGGSGIGVSHRIPEKRKMELKEEIRRSREFSDLAGAPFSFSLLVRTNAKEAALEEILRELVSLSEELLHIQKTAPYRPIFSPLHREPLRWLKRLDSLSEAELEKVLTDDPALFEEMRRYLESSGSSLFSKLTLYQDPLLPMHKLFSLTRELERALSSKVNLKGGGDLVIEQTEALAVIDVNSGRFISKKDKEEAVYLVNLEAAAEAARQIRLRNLSGIILIDFINQTSPDRDRQLLEELRRMVWHDPVRTQVVDRTALGLVEITRRKEEVPLRDQFPLGKLSEFVPDL